jgi:uncharacterized protein YutD
LIRLQAGTYQVVEENRNGWNQEAFKERYSDILDKYDYIVGDWGYGQLRLRGFYENSNRKVPFDQKIAALDEYLQEFCNFGCPYFVLKKVKASSHADQTADVLRDPDEETILPEKRERPQRHFSQRHERLERERHAAPGEKHARGERPDKAGKHMRSEHQQRPEKGFKERRGGGGQNFRPNRDKVHANGGVGHLDKGAQEKRD